MRRQCKAAPHSTRLTAVLAAAVLGVLATGAAAQVNSVKVAPGDDLKPLYATVADVAEGKRIADRSCSHCHGANGVSSDKGVPNLAGQRPAYLLIELRAYKGGARAEKAMEDVVKILNDDTLVQVSAYYASLPPAAPSRAAAKQVAFKDPVIAGKAAAAGCAGCHGDTGVSKIPGTPSLVGLDPKYLVTAMQAYKTGQRKNDLMKSLLAAVSEADMKSIALYFATQKPARAQTPSPGDKASGKDGAAACAGCHGEKGVSSNPATPSIAGQDAQYLAAALQAYKDGSRGDESMKGVASALEDRSMKNLAAFYAGEQPMPPSVVRPLSPPQIAQRCDRCHGVGGNSIDPRLPSLAAQRFDYLEKVLNAYRSGARKSPQMAAMSAVLTEDDVQGLANLYSRQTARHPIYVMVPSK